jgi:hypothetical protein
LEDTAEAFAVDLVEVASAEGVHRNEGSELAQELEERKLAVEAEEHTLGSLELEERKLAVEELVDLA